MKDIKIHITRDQLKDLCKNEISGITKVIHQMKELVSELGIKIDALEVCWNNTSLSRQGCSVERAKLPFCQSPLDAWPRFFLVKETMMAKHTC